MSNDINAEMSVPTGVLQLMPPGVCHRWSCVLAISCVALLPWSGGCSLYHHPYPDAQPTASGYELKTIQVDDFGSFWDPDTAQKTLDDIALQSQSMTSNTYVAVYIHGWHNNAAPHNSNLLQFNHWLAQLAAEFSKPARREARAALTGSPDFRLIGIYVGWRGRALPWILDYGTMWWRKSAAERVGDGDLAEFLTRLQHVYVAANSYSRYSQHPGKTPFTGLFTVGHSFGGQTLLRAIARPLEEQLTPFAPHLTDAIMAVATPADRTPVKDPIDSFGDLNVLVNPATEAYQFARIDGLYRQLSYLSRETPQLVVFSTDNDIPRQAFFPIARALTSPFRPLFKNSFQGSLWGTALGEFRPQRTHELRRAEGNPDSLDDQDFNPDQRHKVAQYDFTGDTVFSGSRLSRLSEVPPIENSPIEVIYTRDKIIDGHDGVFDTSFLDFLSKYVAYIEGKRIVLRFERLNEQKGLEDLRLH